MRKPNYLSPTSFSLWKQNRENFYLRYLSDNKIPREPQNTPMALGAAFDAYIKSYLFERLFGKGSPGAEKFDFDTIFCSQVEPQNRDTAREDGRRVFDAYKSSGVLGDLLTEVTRGSNVRMEFDLYGVVGGGSGNETTREGINKDVSTPPDGALPLMGKPDLSFLTGEGVHVILDWKVNGYYSKWNTSPAAGYIKLRGSDGKDYGSHKKALLGKIGGISVNISDTLDTTKPDWAEQLTIYSWLTGSAVGSKMFVVGIDQIVANSGGAATKIAEHRSTIGESFQRKLFDELIKTWEIVNSDHIFRDMSKEDSIARCTLLDNMYSGGVGNDPFLEDLLR